MPMLTSVHMIARILRLEGRSYCMETVHTGCAARCMDAIPSWNVSRCHLLEAVFCWRFCLLFYGCGCAACCIDATPSWSVL